MGGRRGPFPPLPHRHHPHIAFTAGPLPLQSCKPQDTPTVTAAPQSDANSDPVTRGERSRPLSSHSQRFTQKPPPDSEPILCRVERGKIEWRLAEVLFAKPAGMGLSHAPHPRAHMVMIQATFDVSRVAHQSQRWMEIERDVLHNIDEKYPCVQLWNSCPTIVPDAKCQDPG